MLQKFKDFVGADFDTNIKLSESVKVQELTNIFTQDFLKAAALNYIDSSVKPQSIIRIGGSIYGKNMQLEDEYKDAINKLKVQIHQLGFGDIFDTLLGDF